MKRLKQKDLYRFIPKFLIPHSSFLIARQREKWQFAFLGQIFDISPQKCNFPLVNFAELAYT